MSWAQFWYSDLLDLSSGWFSQQNKLQLFHSGNFKDKLNTNCFKEMEDVNNRFSLMLETFLMKCASTVCSTLLYSNGNSKPVEIAVIKWPRKVLCGVRCCAHWIVFPRSKVFLSTWPLGSSGDASTSWRQRRQGTRAQFWMRRRYNNQFLDKVVEFTARVVIVIKCTFCQQGWLLNRNRVFVYTRKRMIHHNYLVQSPYGVHT